MVTDKMELANSLKEHYDKLLEKLKDSKTQQARLMSQKHASLESRLQDTEKKLSRADAAAQEAKEAAAQANKDADERQKEAKLLLRDVDELKIEMFERNLADQEEVDEMREKLVLVETELRKERERREKAEVRKERERGEKAEFQKERERREKAELQKERERREKAKHRCPPAVTTVAVPPLMPTVWTWRCRTSGCSGYWVGTCAQMHLGPGVYCTHCRCHQTLPCYCSR